MPSPDPSSDGGPQATTDTNGGPTEQPELEHPEVVSGGPRGDDRSSEAVEHPAKVMRIGSMIKLLLEEVRQSELDEASRDRLRDIYET